MDLNKELEPENLTQKDIMTFLLHSTQHVATREELQDVRVELKTDIADVKSEAIPKPPISPRALKLQLSAKGYIHLIPKTGSNQSIVLELEILLLTVVNV
jgi:hypothetical protein